MPFDENICCGLNNNSDVILSRLSKLYDTGRLPNALLLIATNMRAASKVAYDLSNKILHCTDCTQHFDFFQISPEIVNNVQITADAVRELIAKIQVSPKIAHFKIAYIEHAERMNKHAANSFLKTLEEPPTDTVIILSTSNPYLVLPTILSRCVQFRISDSQKIENPVLDHIANTYESWLEMLFSRERKNLAIIEMYKLLAFIEEHAEELADGEVVRKVDIESVLCKTFESSTTKIFKSHEKYVKNLRKIISFFEDFRYLLAINCSLVAYLERCLLFIVQYFDERL